MDPLSSPTYQPADPTPPASPPATPPESSPDRLDDENGDDRDASSPIQKNGRRSQSPEIEELSNTINKQNLQEKPPDDEIGHTNSSHKRRSDELIGLKDELDFEEGRESGEEEGEAGSCSDDESRNGRDDEEEEEDDDLPKEEGELSEEEEEDSALRQEPKTVCRFFNKGQCTWGTNCRFLHPGVSDKGNYNMFAPLRPQTLDEKEEREKAERERPREVRRFVPEASPFETAWERGLRYAKDLMKRANKRKETDADFEEKRLNLGLGQAELDRENDYYTRPASPVYKPVTEEVIDYLDPFERQAVRHFRGGHFENFEVRYNVDPRYEAAGRGNGGPPVPQPHPPHGGRSRREKYEQREEGRGGAHRGRHRGGAQNQNDPRWAWKEPQQQQQQQHGNNKRFNHRRTWNGEDRYKEGGPPAEGATRGEAEAWADPWARRKTPPRRGKKTSRTRSYSTGSSSRSSSRSSRSSSYSSYSRSRSNSSKSSRSSRSGSRSSSGGSKSPKRRFGDRFSHSGTVMIKGKPIQIPVVPSGRRGAAVDPRLNPHRKPMELKVPKQEPRDRDKRPDPREVRTEPSKNIPPSHKERVDAFGRIPKKVAERNYIKSPQRERERERERALSSSRSRSGSSSSSSRSRSRSRNRSGSSSSSSSSSSRASIDVRAERRRLTNAGLNYTHGTKMKSLELTKAPVTKPIKVPVKSQTKKIEKPALASVILDQDSGESDDSSTRLPRKRKAESPPKEVLTPPVSATAAAPAQKKSTLTRRDELLKQLRAVEDAIKRKRAKVV